MDFIWIEDKLQSTLARPRFEHTIGVMYTAGALAMAHKTDVKQALLAGLLHDCAKFGRAEDQIQLCKEYGIVLEEYEIQMPALIHAKLGAYLAQYEYGVEDKDILQSIRTHTTGRAGMTILEKIIYIADYIEPWRTELPEMAEIREYAFSDINKAIVAGARGTIEYLQGLNRAINPLTIQTLQYYGG